MRHRLLHALPFLVLFVALPLALAAARDGDGPVQSSGAEPTAGVSDDDGGAPLFSLAALAPGRSLQRCIRVTYGGDGDGAVRLEGRIEGATLSERVWLTVERGSGGGFGDCRGFRGTTVYDGTLAGFAAAAEAAAWRAEDGDAATYRFTATAAADLPEREDRAAATFTWQASAVGRGGGDGDGNGNGDGDGGPGDGPGARAGVPDLPAAPGA
ncbi:MAG TPA: hypothetical protein VHF89_05720, partial [Solirubrobacteraceae bacterium]|nr:hypothetical protein [Solirubrobacteraceae bacterium]